MDRLKKSIVTYGNTSLIFFLDFICFVTVLATVLGIEFFVRPAHNGFFCEDLSIRYPHQKDTIPKYACYGACLFIPVIIIVITETLMYRSDKEAEERNLLQWFAIIYKTAGVFLFGIICALLIVNVTKVLTGKLGPNFMDTCDPEVDCKLSKRHYINIYKCKSTSNSHVVKESRMSFPSGQATVAAFSLFYLVIYIQVKMTWKPSHFFKRLIQVVLMLLALIVAYLRVMDNARHWTDVAFGLILGTLGAYLTTVYLSSFYLVKKSKSIFAFKTGSRVLDFDDDDDFQENLFDFDRPSPSKIAVVPLPSKTTFAIPPAQPSKPGKK